MTNHFVNMLILIQDSWNLMHGEGSAKATYNPIKLSIYYIILMKQAIRSVADGRCLTTVHYEFKGERIHPSHLFAPCGTPTCSTIAPVQLCNPVCFAWNVTICWQWNHSSEIIRREKLCSHVVLIMVHNGIWNIIFESRNRMIGSHGGPQVCALIIYGP